MIRIVSFTICPFVQRVTAMLEAKRVPYEIDYISLSDKPDWFLELSPTGQVPVLVTEDGTALFESDAIVEYIDEITAPLQAGRSPEERARDRAWSYQAAKHYLVQCGAMQSADKTTLDQRIGKLDASFERTERIFGDGPFFAGDTLGNVDIAWLPLLHRAALVEDHSGYDMLSAHPRVKVWQKALLATGLAEKSVSKDFDRKFAEFYLSEHTWLGRGARSGEAAIDTDAKAATGGCCG